MNEDTDQRKFPTDRLPAAMAAIVRESARVNRVPESMPACVALATVSASLGAGLRMAREAGKFTRGNLMVLVGAESGTGKSEVFADLTAPLYQCEDELRADWKRETLPQMLADKDIAEGELKRLHREMAGDKKGVPKGAGEMRETAKEIRARLDEIECALKREPRLIVEEITEEKLAAIAEGQALESIASFSSDARQVMRILSGRYSKSDSAEAVLLKMFSGDKAVIDRMNRAGVVLRNPCLASLWMLQPDLVGEMFSNDGFDQGGLLPRLLVCDSGAEVTEIPEHVEPMNPEALRVWSALLGELVIHNRLASEPSTIEPEQEALDAFRECYNEIVARRRSDLRDVGAYPARWAEMAQRIAVVLHAALHGGQAHRRPLTRDTAERAIDIARWFAGEQLRHLTGRREGKRESLWKSVEEMARKLNPEPITERMVYRRRIVRDAKDARQLLAAMVEGGILRPEEVTPERGGTVSTKYHLVGRPNK